VGYVRSYVNGFSIMCTVSVDIFGRTLNLFVSVYSELETLDFRVHADTHFKTSAYICPII